MTLAPARFGKLAALAVLFLALLLSPSRVLAGPFEDALPKLAADSFSDTLTAIAEISTSGHPNAEPVISAIADGRLLFDHATKTIYLRSAGGKILNVTTGAAEPALPAGAKPVRLNNRIRTTLDAALGTLRLLSPDRNKRLEAAAAVFKSRDASALKLVEEAFAKETDPRVKRALGHARAAIIASDTNAPEAARIAAINEIGARGDAEALDLLNKIPPGSSPAIKAAIDSAAAAVQRSLAWWEIGQNVWYGLSLGSVLLLAAIGLAITFGVMGVINMAHGEMVMIGAYVTFVVQETIRQNAPGLFDYSLAIALPLAFLIAGFVGILIERGVIRFLYGRPLETLLATWGLSLVLQQAVRTAFGPTNREVGAPSWMSGAFELGGLSITYNRLWIIVFSLAVFAMLLFVLRYTRFGLEMRAVTQNRRMASSMGIKTSYVDALTFGLGSGIAGIAGVALSQIDNVSPNLGQGYIIDSFLVVVFGGVGNLFGTLIAALSLGIANKFLEPVAGAVLGKILIVVLIILFIQKKPRGLFALKGRAVES
ncbi:MAG TPA: urea ABC transporter permease subunit UrtB [Xanthobacteraceae bacterium]|nr:urea ABC transporter permease subunit UrtB [Xanthobacteraceae bacterium]